MALSQRGDHYVVAEGENVDVESAIDVGACNCDHQVDIALVASRGKDDGLLAAFCGWEIVCAESEWQVIKDGGILAGTVRRRNMARY